MARRHGRLASGGARRWRAAGAALLLVASVAAAVGASVPAGAAASLTLTPATGLSGGDTITIDAAGFPPGVVAGWCQAVSPSGPPTTDDCGVNTTYGRTVAADGTFSGQAAVERFIYVPSLGRWVDCADPSDVGCGIGAAVESDVAGTAVAAPLDFAPVPPPPATRGTIAVDPDPQVAGER